MSKTTLKTIGYVALAIVLAICLAVDGVFIYVKFFAPEKTITSTYYLSTISTSDSEDQESYVISVKYYSNFNGNGLEAFEIMFNMFTDESASSIVSYGVQLVANEYSTSTIFGEDALANMTYVYDQSSLTWDYKAYTPGANNATWFNFIFSFLSWTDYYSLWGSGMFPNVTYSYYYSDDEFENFTIKSYSNFLNDGMVITLSGDSDTMYRISFRGDVYLNEETHTDSDSNYITTDSGNSDVWSWAGVYNQYINMYQSIDMFYLVNSLAYQFSGATQNGTTSAHWINLGNIFNYQYYDGKGWVDLDPSDTTAKDKFTFLETTYGGINIEVTADGLSTASQSMFNAVNGSAQYDNGYNTDGDTSDSDFGYARQIVTCDIYDFEYILVSDKFYALQLSEEFLKNYYSLRDLILLSVQIDVDALNKNAVSFYGFVDDTFDGFTVYECYTYTTVDGEKVITEVDYA